jgi:tRNA A37 threonylcarbamoyladenosine dehydratase
MSNTSKLVAIAATSALAGAALLEAYHRYSSIGKSDGSPKKRKNVLLPSGEHDEELIREQLARNYAFLGEDGMAKIRDQFVVVVGAGGVGSWVCTMLIRAGVKKLRIIDFDQVSLSSLNRHAVATLEDVGTSKVECLKKHLLKIAPWAVIEPVNQLWHLPNAEETLLHGSPTFIVDCIDNIDTKVDLLAFAHEHDLKIVSSMGAACKSDPSRINIGDISNTEEDSLARAVRRRLKQKGIVSKIPVVFSAEKPDPRKAQLLPLPEDEFQKGKVDELSALKDFRVRILPVLGTMPAVFGLTIVTYILTSVAGYPIEPIQGKNRIKIYDGIFQTLAAQQSRTGQDDQRVPIALKEVPYIVEEVFRGKSPISGFSTKLTLSRWDPKKPVGLTNVVIMTKDEQKIHEDRVLNGGEELSAVYPDNVLELVQRRFKEEEYYEQFR